MISIKVNQPSFLFQWGCDPVVITFTNETPAKYFTKERHEWMDVECLKRFIVFWWYRHEINRHYNRRRQRFVYSFSSDLTLALGLVTRMASCWARSTSPLRFLADTPWAISAQNFLFCIIKTSNSWNDENVNDEIDTFSENVHKLLDWQFFRKCP